MAIACPFCRGNCNCRVCLKEDLNVMVCSSVPFFFFFSVSYPVVLHDTFHMPNKFLVLTGWT